MKQSCLGPLILTKWLQCMLTICAVTLSVERVDFLHAWRQYNTFIHHEGSKYMKTVRKTNNRQETTSMYMTGRETDRRKTK